MKRAQMNPALSDRFRRQTMPSLCCSPVRAVPRADLRVANATTMTAMIDPIGLVTRLNGAAAQWLRRRAVRGAGQTHEDPDLADAEMCAGLMDP